jgi:hypothetical protein
VTGLSWPFVLVNGGLEKVRVTNGREVKFEGTVPAGYVRHLVVGDGVLSWVRGRWHRKFYVALDKGQPCVRFPPSSSTPKKRLRLDTSQGLAIDPCRVV